MAFSVIIIIAFNTNSNPHFYWLNLQLLAVISKRLFKKMMKNLKTKIFDAILAFTIGIFGVWASSILLSFPLFFAQPDPWLEIDAIPTNEPFVEETFGNVEIHYQRRLKIEGENYVEFEIINRNLLPVGYIGYGKD